MARFYIVDYIWTEYFQKGKQTFTYKQHHISQLGFNTLEEAQHWCETRGNAPTQETPMRYHWIENGDCYYSIHEIITE